MYIINIGIGRQRHELSDLILRRPRQRGGQPIASNTATGSR
jgi:hypothetical protein